MKKNAKPVELSAVQVAAQNLNTVIGTALIVIGLAIVAMLAGHSEIILLLVAGFFLGGYFWTVRKSGEQRRKELEPVYRECDEHQNQELARMFEPEDGE